MMVTGASGAGKTAILPELSRVLGTKALVFDVDGILDSFHAQAGSSEISWPALRDTWLAVAHGVAQSGLPTVLLGPFLPSQFEELPARRWVGALRFLNLDCPDDVRRARLAARPAWRGRDFEGQVAFGRWLRANIDTQLDTTIGAPADTAGRVASWVTATMDGLRPECDEPSK